MTWLPFLWVALWLAHVALAPVKSGKANRSNPLFITRATQETIWDGSITRFVFVQERGEFRLYKSLAALIGTGVLAVATAAGVDPAVLIVAAPVGLAVIELAVRGLSAIDVAGHGAEIMAAQVALPAKEAAAYAEREAQTVADQYDIMTDEARVWLNESRWLARIVYRLGAA